MARICMISLNYAPEPIGIGPYSQGWAEHLAGRGHEVRVICGVPYYPDWQLAAGFAQEFSDSCERGVQVKRVPHHLPARPNTIGRLRHYLSFASNVRKVIRRGTADFEPELVISIAPSLLAAPVAIGAARRAGAVTWLHIQDFEVEAAVATGLLPGPVARLAARFEASIISRFDRVSTISPKMVAKAEREKGAAAPVAELRNWAEPEVGGDAANGDAMRAKLDLPPGLIALYSGNLARKQGVGLILEAARAMQARPDLQFVVCGEGPAAGEIAAAAAHLPNLHLRPLQPRDRLPDLLAMADLHLLPQIAGAADLVLPSKLANMLASGRPVVATSDPGTSLAHEVEGCGLCTPAGDTESFARAIEALASDASMRRSLGREAAQRATERWSRQALLAKMADEIERAIAERGE
ncbi:glycosyltransferase WbuB [Erythrobacter litoralis]|nr:glycosyltransferase WbuB [Erythrobacter litoralis]